MIRKDFLPLARPSCGPEEMEAAREVLASGWWTTGPMTTRFEEALAAYLGEGQPLYCVGLSSCSAALHLSLEALGVGPGHEVIVPTWTFAASALTVEWAGAAPRLCDIREEDFGLDVARAASSLTEKTKAVMPVHIGGAPCDLDAVARFADEHGLVVVEDAAHAIGTRHRGRRIGGLSRVSCFSFYATKNLAMGEGGAAVSADPELIEAIRRLGYFGINKKAFNRYGKGGTWYYEVESKGFKYNLDSMHAAIGLCQLEKLEAMNDRRRELAARYKNALSPDIKVPTCDPAHLHAYHLFMVLLPEGLDRDACMEELKRRNIGASVHFIPLHRHAYFRKDNPPERFPTAERLFPRVLSLPLFPDMTEEDVDYVAHHLNDIVGRS